jgi:hypothetical protein
LTFFGFLYKKLSFFVLAQTVFLKKLSLTWRIETTRVTRPLKKIFISKLSYLVYKEFWAVVPGSRARQSCRAVVPGSFARQSCPAVLSGSLARQSYPAVLPGNYMLNISNLVRLV